MDIINCIQGSPEWYQARLGMITASCFDDVLNKGQGRETYLIKLVAERLSGIAQEGFTNAAMQWGTEQEPYARELYSSLNGDIPVEQVGFVQHDGYVGYSPDGLIGLKGTVEIKCPNTSTHISYILKDKLPAKYVPQVQGGLWITGREWCDFVSFDPRIKRKIHIIRVERDESKISEIKTAVEKFKAELIEMVSKLDINL
jgi:hypothetical protein